MPVNSKPCVRHDGWTLERQAIFLATLERTGNVRAAAGAAGMNRASAYRLRERADGKVFSHAWNLALSRRRARLLEERLAKATLLLARAGPSSKGDTRAGASFPRKSDESDTFGASSKLRQPSQACRLRPDHIPEAVRLAARRASQGGHRIRHPGLEPGSACFESRDEKADPGSSPG